MTWTRFSARTPAPPAGGAPAAIRGNRCPAAASGSPPRLSPPGVSQSRRRYPFREFTRSGLTSPYPAPQMPSTSASIIFCAKPRIISRSRSGLADFQRVLETRACNRHNVTHGHLVSSFVGLSTTKDHEVAALRHADTPGTNETVTTEQASHTPLPWTRPRQGRARPVGCLNSWKTRTSDWKPHIVAYARAAGIGAPWRCWF